MPYEIGHNIFLGFTGIGFLGVKRNFFDIFIEFFIEVSVIVIKVDLPTFPALVDVVGLLDGFLEIELLRILIGLIGLRTVGASPARVFPVLILEIIIECVVCVWI